jgi:molybdopterin molybdotransferase
VVLTSGGASVGDADYVKQILDRLGEVLFWKIAMKPGRPLAFGRIGNTLLFGLPGNPVAVMVTFYQFVREALLVLMGQPEVPPFPAFKAVLASPLRKAPGRVEFQRGILAPSADASWQVRLTGEQGSNILSSMSRANCFVVLPVDCGNLEPGALVDVQPFEGVL